MDNKIKKVLTGKSRARDNQKTIDSVIPKKKKILWNI